MTDPVARDRPCGHSDPRSCDLSCRVLALEAASGTEPPRRFPLQGADAIPWGVAQRAYETYAARYGTSQSLDQLAQRGGWSPGEMDAFLPGWRDLAYPAVPPPAAPGLREALLHVASVIDALEPVGGMGDDEYRGFQEGIGAAYEAVIAVRALAKTPGDAVVERLDRPGNRANGTRALAGTPREPR